MISIKNNFEKATELVAKMTLEEKAGLCSGQDFWTLKSIERLGLSTIMVADGPHGIRKQAGATDHLGLNTSIPATCFPTASATANSFDKALLKEMGKALGDECLANGVSVLLGPGVNIKRHPLCGRNFEYISEDPVVTADLACSFIKGVQSKNVGVSMKHYLANNQEKARMSSDSIVDERALREIYMPSFEKAVKTEQPATLMCAYNKINGTYASDTKLYMTDIPRGEWGFEGLIITDWGAMNDRALAIKAGLDLEMPGNNGINDKKIIEAVNNGFLTEEELNLCAVRITALILGVSSNKQLPYDIEEHNQLARKIARESAVLLKNDGILPLNKSDKVLVVGEFAKSPRYQGAGSSKINSTKITSFIDELETNGIDFEYVQGYSKNNDKTNQNLLNEAITKAKSFDKVICIVGLPDNYESEGFDRAHMNMPASHNQLITELLRVNSNIATIIYAGSPVCMPWKDEVSAILNMYLGGQNVGGATYDLIFGDFSPCGKLAETYPISLNDVSSNTWFANDDKIVPYMESIYVGYRYFDKAEKSVAYPFGYGLSYTTFKYSNLTINGMNVSCDITNAGNTNAKEIVQLYIKNSDSKIFKAVRELKAFEKVELEAGQTKTISFTLDDRCFAYWNVNIHNWHVESGDYTVEIGASSRDIKLSQVISINGDDTVDVPDYHKIAASYYNLSNGQFDISEQEFEKILGRTLPIIKIGKPFTTSSTIKDIQSTMLGRQFSKVIINNAMKMLNSSNDEELNAMGMAMIMDLPLRSLAMLSNGVVSLNKIECMVELINGHYIKAFKAITKKN